MKYLSLPIIENNVKTDTLIIKKINEVYLSVDCEYCIKQELSDYFSFQVQNYQFIPSYKNGMWDGRIRLYNTRTNELYFGLLSYLLHFAEERNYEIIMDESVYSKDSFSYEEAISYFESLELPFEPRDYQVDYFVHAVRNKRALLLSPTGSGKSFIQYLIASYFQKKTLLIVPTTALVNQMRDDFISYGCDPNDIHIIMAGKEKITDKKIIISTWQSLAKLPKKWFNPFGLVLGDECHLFSADSLKGIMHKLESCELRFGFTGTIKESKCHKLVLEGLFGKVKKIVSTQELIDKGALADLSIKVLMLKYTEEERKFVSKLKYQDELDFILAHPRRNKFILDLCLKLKGNTLLMFEFVEKHGKPLYEYISKKRKNVHYVYGGTKTEQREKIRLLVEENDDILIIASRVFSTGTNMIKLHNIISTSPTKSKIKTLQTIGRSLRKSIEKQKANYYDLADDLKYKTKINYSLKHFNERLKNYIEEGFEYEIFNIKI
jgi:superfamily II DNA or RNA helicase